jgi:uncharacterized protein
LDVLILLSLALVGLVAGTVSGMFGVGGGIIVVPSLVLLTGLGFRDAVAASLLFMIFTSPFGIARYARAKNVDFRVGLTLGAAGIVGILCGTWVALRVSDRTLVIAFAALLVVSAQNLAYGRLPTRHRRSIWLIVATGIFSGFVAKLFGIGGGIVVVPALVFTGVPIHLAIGTSLFTVFSNAFVASGVNLLTNPGAWALWAIPIGIGALVGVQLGAVHALRSHGAALKRWFALLMLIVALQLAKTAF